MKAVYVIFVCIIVLLLIKCFFYKLIATSLVHFIKKNNIEMTDGQKDEAVKETLYRWFKVKRQ